METEAARREAFEEELLRRSYLSHKERLRLEQEDRHRSQYPPKLHFRDQFHIGGSSASELVQKVLEDGLDPNTLWTYEDIIDPDSTSARNKYGCTWRRWNTPLHLALLCYDYESARIVLQHGGDPNVYNGDGRTAIHEAIKLQNLEGIRFLLHHGADPNRASQDGLVPLHAALYEGNEEIFFTLLEGNATLEAAAYYEWSITDLALLASENSILERLMSDEYGQLPTPLMQSLRAAPYPKPQDIAISAKRILAVATSNRVLPEKTLYEAYHHLASGLNILQDQTWDADAVNDLIIKLMDSFYTVSQIPRLALGEKVCSECLGFQTFIERFSRDRAAAKHEAYEKVVNLHKNTQELDDCALSGCPICLTISKRFHKLFRGSGEGFQHYELLPVGLKLRPQSEDLIEEQLDPRRIDSFDAQLGDSESRLACFDLRPYDTAFEIHQEYPLGKPYDTEFEIYDEMPRGNCPYTSTGSPKSMSVAKQWLQICRTSPEHSSCRETYGPSGTCGTLPTRVLNVGSENREPFLFEGNGLKESYCILSYCWGLSGNAVTTKENISQRTQCIPLASLPTLLRQAILAARSLGYTYIWIDALCIIQDDPKDWDREAAVMHQLYSQADLTITSLVAAKSSESLFESLPRETTRPIPLEVCLPKKYRHPWNESTFEFAAYPGHHHISRGVFEGPVHRRGWTLQEYLMSTRVVYFGAGILHWECLRSYRVEPDPEAICVAVSCPVLDTRLRLKLAVKTLQQQESAHQTEETPFEVWQSQVEEFTRRELAKHSDRIPAFLAISKVLCKAGGDEFAGGLWTGKQLIPSMCWQLKLAHNMGTTGPSWTWGSHFGEISYELLRHPGKMMPKAFIISVDISTNNRSHSNISGSITLRGFLGTCKPDSKHPNSESSPVFESGISEWFDHTSESRDNLYIFDMLESGQTPSSPSTGMKSCYGPPQKHTISLLLKPVDVGKDFRTASVFRRVGIANKAELEDCSVSNNDGHDKIAQSRDVTDFETDRVVVIV